MRMSIFTIEEEDEANDTSAFLSSNGQYKFKSRQASIFSM